MPVCPRCNSASLLPASVTIGPVSGLTHCIDYSPSATHFNCRTCNNVFLKVEAKSSDTGKVKLWLDDVRTPPQGWIWLKTYKDMIQHIESYNGQIDIISLDHDLPATDRMHTGRDVSLWILQQCYTGKLKKCKMQVHSANGDGGFMMLEDLRQAYLHLNIYHPVYWIDGDHYCTGIAHEV